MTPRFRLAVLAAILALLLSAAIVPFVDLWHSIERTPWIADPQRPGRFKQIAIAFPVYWFYVAAGLGSFLASLTALRSGEAVRVRSLLLFLLLCDFFYAWIGGIGYGVSLHLLAPDLDASYYRDTMQHLDTYGRILQWAALPITGLPMGLLFGNLGTLGFGFVIGLPTIVWLALRPSLVRLRH